MFACLTQRARGWVVHCRETSWGTRNTGPINCFPVCACETIRHGKTKCWSRHKCSPAVKARSAVDSPRRVRVGPDITGFARSGIEGWFSCCHWVEASIATRFASSGARQTRVCAGTARLASLTSCPILTIIAVRTSHARWWIRTLSQYVQPWVIVSIRWYSHCHTQPPSYQTHSELNFSPLLNHAEDWDNRR